MKRFQTIAAAAIISPLFIISSGSADDHSVLIQPVPGNPPIAVQANPIANDAQIQQQLNEANAKIDQLQRQLDDLRQTLDRLQNLHQTQRNQILVPPRQPLDNSRQDWIPRQFNGMQYYIVPIEAKPTTMPAQ